MSQRKLRELILSLLIFAISGIPVQAEPKDLTFTVTLEQISLNDSILPAGPKIADFVTLLGKPSRSRDAEKITFYLWDALGLEIREQNDSKRADQISVHLNLSSKSGPTNGPTKPFPGKLFFVKREVTALTSPEEFAPVQKCRGIFCRITVGKNKVYAIMDMEKTKYDSMLISLP